MIFEREIFSPSLIIPSPLEMSGICLIIKGVFEIIVALMF